MPRKNFLIVKKIQIKVKIVMKACYEGITKHMMMRQNAIIVL